MANVGDAGSDQRQQWWDKVISKAYSIQNIPEIRRPADPGPDQPSWRNRLGGTTAERETNWLALPRLGVNGAEFLRAALGLQIQLVADTYDLITLLRPNHPINTLDRAEENLNRLVFADIIWGPEEEPIPRGGEAPLVPLAPPCSPDDPRFGDDDGCTPDPSYVPLDWTLEQLPFLNSAVCEYYIPIGTAYPCPGADELPDRVLEYAPDAIIALMDFLNKEYDPEATEGISYAARTGISSYIVEESAYEFDKSPNRNLKLLYKVPFHLIQALRLVDRAPPPANQTPLPGATTEIETASLIANLDRLRIGLKQFTKEQSVAWKVDGTKIVKVGSSLEVNIGSKSELIEGLKEAISAILNTNQYKMALGVDNVSKASNLPDYQVKGNQYVANNMVLTVSSNYELQGIAVKERGSDLKQISISSVASASPLRDPTLLAYLVNLEDILFDLNKTSTIDFMEFATKYQFPPVEVVYASMDNATQSPNEGGACDNLSPADVGNLIGNSVLDMLVEVSDLFADQFTEYGCMTPQQLKERNKRVAQSSKKMKKILDDQQKKKINTGDPLLLNIGDTVTRAINQGGDITVAWEKLFNKMTMCGLLSLILKTLKTIASTSVCGISLEETLRNMIGSALSNVEPPDMRRLFENTPPVLQDLLLDRYRDNFEEIAASMGYTGGTIFPWEYEEEQATQQDRRDRGIVLYEVPEFSITTSVERVIGASGAYASGVARDLSALPPGNDATAFWSGYLNDFGTDNVIAIDEIIDYANDIVPVNKTVDFATAIAQAFVKTLIEILDIDQLVALTKEIPVIGGLIQAIVQVGKCVVNRNLEAAGADPIGSAFRALDFSSMMNNIPGGDKDLCELITSAMPAAPGKKKKGPKRPIALPDLELIMQALKTSTSWSAIQDTIIAVLKEKMIQILVSVLVKMISKAAEALLGAVCSLMNGSVEQALGQEARNPLSDDNLLAAPPKDAMKTLFSAAFCNIPGGLGSLDVDSLVGNLMSSLGGLDPLESVALTGTDSVDNFMSAVSSRVSIDQMLDLLQGEGSPATAEAVVDVLQERAVPLKTLFSNPSTVMDFFGNLGAAFPSGFLQQARQNLVSAGVTQQTISSICDPDPLSELADALREECGDAITEEQIQAQVENFERRMQDLVGDLSNSFGSGLEKSMTKTIQDSIASTLPKDEPGNLTIVDDVISSLLDPFYLQYAQELMRPLNPITRAGGFLNLVLANKDGVPQRGQINTYNMLASFPLLPPPFNELIEEGASEVLRNNMFGPGVESRKPPTVAKQLQTYLVNGMGARFDGDVITLEAAVPGALIYNLNYNLNSGYLESLRLSPIPIPPVPPLPPPMPPFVPEFANPFVIPNRSYKFEFSEKDEQLERLGNLLYTATSAGPSLAATFGLIGGASEDFTAPLNVGTAVLAQNFINNGFSLGGANALGDFGTLVQTLRKSSLEALGYAIAFPGNQDNPAFIYGEYNIEKLNREDLFNSLNQPDPTEAILERGYKVSQLGDGSGKIMVQPPLKGGWLEVKDILMPPSQDEFCCPQRKELFNIEGIKADTRESYKNIEDDPRLSLNPKTVNEPPYAKILSRMNLAASEALVVTTTRLYIIDYFLRSLAPFRFFKTSIPSAFSRLLPEFVAQQMRKGMKAQGPFPGAPLNPVPNPEDLDPYDNNMYGYWYEFLEQTVQAYARRATAKAITPSPQAEAALLKLQQFIEGYKNPSPADLLAERIAASVFLGPIAFLAITMKGLRRRKKLTALAATEDLAMIIMNDFIRTEFEKIAAESEQIFTAPPGGWSDSVYLNFLDGAYTIRDIDTNIFDIPSIHGPAGRNPLLNGLARSDFGEKSQFVLESYVRIVKNSSGLARWGESLEDGIYGIEELKLVLLDIEDLPTTVDLTPEQRAVFSFRPPDYFSTFKVGLRLVYVPVSEDLPGGAGSVRDAMTESSFDNETRLFKQFSLPSEIGWGRFSIPLVFSRNAEMDYGSAMLFFFDNVRMVGANTRSGFTGPGTINWRSLAEQLVSTEEFRAMFEYAVPLPSLNSLISIYCSQAFVETIGYQDDWLFPPIEPPPGVPGMVAYAMWSGQSFKPMKRRLKRSFLNIYNSNDFTYREEPLGAKERAAVNELRRNTDISSWEDGIGPEWRDRVLIESALTLCTDTEDTE